MSTPPQEFAGQRVLLTGAAQGIGAELAYRFAQAGARLWLLDRQAEALQAVGARLASIGCVPALHAVDLGQRSTCDAVLAQCLQASGGFDILVSVAGVLHPGSAQSFSDEDWDASFAVNCTAVARLCRAVVPAMRERGSGVIVAVSSNATRVPRSGMAAYAASKAAMAQYLRCLGLELAPRGVRCNLVSPGSTDTAMQRQLWRSEADRAAMIRGVPEQFRGGIPLGRIAEPSDVAAAVLFLASNAARHITLQDLCVDGGATLGA